MEPHFWYLDLPSLKFVPPLHPACHPLTHFFPMIKIISSSLLIMKYKRDKDICNLMDSWPHCIQKTKKAEAGFFLPALSGVFPLFLLLFQCEITPRGCKHRTQLLPWWSRNNFFWSHFDWTLTQRRWNQLWLLGSEVYCEPLNSQWPTGNQMFWRVTEKVWNIYNGIGVCRTYQSHTIKYSHWWQ